MRLRANRLEGRVAFGDRDAATLAVKLDGRRHDDIPEVVVRRETEPEGWFAIHLPHTLNDGRARKVSVRHVEAGAWLTAGAGEALDLRVAQDADLAGRDGDGDVRGGYEDQDRVLALLQRHAPP